MNYRIIKWLCFIVLMTSGVFLISCKSPSESESKPLTAEILQPQSETTYWNDQKIPCTHNQQPLGTSTEWLINGEPIICLNNELGRLLDVGEHTVTLRVSRDKVSKESKVNITVREGFSFEISDLHLRNTETNESKLRKTFFSGDEIRCEVKISPEYYLEDLDDLKVTVDGAQNCLESAILSKGTDVLIEARASLFGRTVTDTVRVQVLPAVAGRLLPLSSSGVISASGRLIELNVDDQQYETRVSNGNRFRFAKLPPDIFVKSEITFNVPETNDYYGSKVTISGFELQEIIKEDSLGFLLIPHNWQVSSGKFSGMSAPIKLHDAFNSNSDPFSNFFDVSNIFGTLVLNHTLSTDRPLKVAFNHDNNSEDITITSADSIAFWKGVTEIESYIGHGKLFTPDVMDRNSTGFDGIQVWVDTSSDNASVSSYYFSGDTGVIDASSGGVIIYNEKKYFESSIQKKTMIRLLGIGTNCRWPGLLVKNNGCGPGPYLSNLSKIETAHIQLYLLTFEVQYREGISFGLIQTYDFLGLDKAKKINMNTDYLIYNRENYPNKNLLEYKRNE